MPNKKYRNTIFKPTLVGVFSCIQVSCYPAPSHGGGSAMFSSDLLQGKTALITGGGTGLGKAMAKRYLELGAKVYICGRREDVLQSTCRELAAATGGSILGFPCD